MGLVGRYADIRNWSRMGPGHVVTEFSSTVACGVENGRLDGLGRSSSQHFLQKLRLKGWRRAGPEGRACVQRSGSHWSPLPSAFLGTRKAHI